MMEDKQRAKKADSTARPQLYQLKVTLRNIKPPVWRRLLVRGDSTLADLHTILQTAMGWEDCHLYTFTVHDREYCVPRSEWDVAIRDVGKVTLSKLRLAPKSRFTYLYDMGDSWNHEILVEAVTKAETENPRRARCLAGARACPPEDIGGSWRYMYIMEAMRDPKHKEHEEALDRIGHRFDPEAFSVARTDAALERL